LALSRKESRTKTRKLVRSENRLTKSSQNLIRRAPSERRSRHEKKHSDRRGSLSESRKEGLEPERLRSISFCIQKDEENRFGGDKAKEKKKSYKILVTRNEDTPTLKLEDNKRGKSHSEKRIRQDKQRSNNDKQRDQVEHSSKKQKEVNHTPNEEQRNNTNNKSKREEDKPISVNNAYGDPDKHKDYFIKKKQKRKVEDLPDEKKKLKPEKLKLNNLTNSVIEKPTKKKKDKGKRKLRDSDSSSVQKVSQTKQKNAPVPTERAVDKYKEDETDTTDPVAFLELTSRGYDEQPLLVARRAKYIHLKCLSSQQKDTKFSFSYIGFVGYRPELNKYLAPPKPYLLQGIGERLGVSRKIIKEFVHTSDFDSNGLLYWVGRDEGKSLTWRNPAAFPPKIIVSTSHPMFQNSMIKENIVGRTNTVTYWGGGSPQYFIVDLVKYEMFITAYTLRHGYNVANSYIQDFCLEGSKDSKTWELVHQQKDTPFRRPYDTVTFHVSNGKDYFRYWKVSQRGNYSMGHGRSGGAPYLCLAGFEVYGEVRFEDTG